MTFGDSVPILMICKGKPMKIFNGGGGIQVGSMWDPCGIRMDFNGILLGIKWDPCGIPMDLNGTLLGIKWDPWGTHMGYNGILFWGSDQIFPRVPH